MADCNKYLEWISAYIDGELSEAEQIELFVHLEACPACAQVLQAYQTLTFGIQDAEVDPPAHLADDIMAQILPSALHVVEGGRPRRGKRLQQFLTVAALFAVVGVIGFAHLFGGFGGEQTEGSLRMPAPAMESQADVSMARSVEQNEFLTDEGAFDTQEQLEAANEEEFDPQLSILGGDSEPIDMGNVFLDRFLLAPTWTGEPWTWIELERIFEDYGYYFVFDEGTFTVEDPYNPGSFLYGVLGGHPETGESFVGTLGYYFHFEAGRAGRRVEVRFWDGFYGEAQYYYAVPSFDTGGTRAQDWGALRAFILGNR